MNPRLVSGMRRLMDDAGCSIAKLGVGRFEKPLTSDQTSAVADFLLRAKDLDIPAQRIETETHVWAEAYVLNTPRHT